MTHIPVNIRIFCSPEKSYDQILKNMKLLLQNLGSVWWGTEIQGILFEPKRKVFPPKSNVYIGISG